MDVATFSGANPWSSTAELLPQFDVPHNTNMSNVGSRTIPINQDDIEETDKLEDMIEALVCFLWERLRIIDS